MTKKSQDGAPDLLTLAMRRAHAETVEGRAPKHPPDDEDTSVADTSEAASVRSSSADPGSWRS